MSTFSGLNTAYTGLVAARTSIDVIGQNIVNATTEGYTRQRVGLAASQAPGSLTSFARMRAGQGVDISGISRLGDGHLDARVRTAFAAQGHWAVQASVRGALESSLNEPGPQGLSAQFQSFWASWQDLANRATDPAAAGVVLEEANAVVTRIADGYRTARGEWASLRSQLTGMVDELNAAATQLGLLNAEIDAVTAAGGSANELIDRRVALAQTVAELAGGRLVERPDGTVDVLVGGNALVSGSTVRPIQLGGALSMDAASGDPVTLSWTHRPGDDVAADGGRIAAALALLAPAAGGSGGTIAEHAEFFNGLAAQLASAVNAVHQTGSTPGGTSGLDFFGFAGAGPAALMLRVVPAGAGDIATGAPGAGASDGSIADRISLIGQDAGGPDRLWTDFVVATGVATRSAAQQEALASRAAASAWTLQLSQSAVDVDEEYTNLISAQYAYQGSARVMTAIDELLDVLINRTGVVGR